MLQYDIPTYAKINYQCVIIRCANENLWPGFKLISCKNTFRTQLFVRNKKRMNTNTIYLSIQRFFTIHSSDFAWFDKGISQITLYSKAFCDGCSVWAAAMLVLWTSNMADDKSVTSRENTLLEFRLNYNASLHTYISYRKSIYKDQL